MSEENQEQQEVEINEKDIQDLDEMLDIAIICADLIQRYPKISNPQIDFIGELKHMIQSSDWKYNIHMLVESLTRVDFSSQIPEGKRLSEAELLTHLMHNFMVCACEGFVKILPALLESDIDNKGMRKLGMSFKIDVAEAFVRGKASVGTKTDFEFREAVKIKPAQTEMQLGDAE